MNHRPRVRPLTAWMLLGALLQASCGGGTDANSLKTKESAPAENMVTALGVKAVSQIGDDAPQVEQLDLVSEKRIDRTRYEYTFKVSVRGSGASFKEGAFAVSSSAATTTVVDGTFSIGSISAGQVVRSSDTFSVRHDRTVPFDKTKLNFAFAGSKASAVAGGEALTIGKVSLYQLGGRIGHGGMVEVRTDRYAPGEKLELRTTVFGTPTSVDYSLVDEAGQILSRGALTRLEAGSQTYKAAIEVPASAFKISVAAASAAGASLTWTSNKFQPQAFGFNISFEKPTFKVGEVLKGRITSPLAAAPEGYTLKLMLPDEFSANVVSWKVNTKAGQAVDFTFDLTPSADARFISSYIYLVWSKVNAPNLENTSSARVLGL